MRKAVKWNSPFYGIEGQGWFLGFHVFTQLRQGDLLPRHVAATGPARRSKGKDTRYIDIHEGDELDEAQMATLGEAGRRVARLGALACTSPLLGEPFPRRARREDRQWGLPATESKSWSPVTSMSASAASAEATIHRSSGSRMGRSEGARGLGTTVSPRKSRSIWAASSAGTRSRSLRTRRSSTRTTSPTIRTCSASTRRIRSAQSPRAMCALTSTLVSKKTLTTPGETRPRRSGDPRAPRTAAGASGCPRTASGSPGAGARPGRRRCGCGPADDRCAQLPLEPRVQADGDGALHVRQCSTWRMGCRGSSPASSRRSAIATVEGWLRALPPHPARHMDRWEPAVVVDSSRTA